MPNDTLSKFLLLPELKLIRTVRENQFNMRHECEKTPSIEYCPKCASPSSSVYDHRWVRIKDAPIRSLGSYLKVRKRRLWCKKCLKPFTEPLPGVQKGKRHTERFFTNLHWACESFSDLKRVKRTYRCSSRLLYHVYYNRLERERLEKLSYPWPNTIGIDEHSFRRNKRLGRTEFASIVVDYSNRRVFELVEGKTEEKLVESLSHIEGRENVRNVVLDMCDPFKNFAKQHFPNAKIIADKFHVLRLITPSLMRKRYQITGTRADLRARRLLTVSSHKLDHWERQAIWNYLAAHPDLQELYRWKEIIHRFYRTKGFRRASSALTMITDRMAGSQLQEIKTLRRTLMKWRTEILAYFETGLTNGRTEGYNNIAKLVQRRGFGYKSFRNYRLKVLTACA